MCFLNSCIYLLHSWYVDRRDKQGWKATTLRHFLLNFKKFIQHVKSTELKTRSKLSERELAQLEYTVTSLRKGNDEGVRERRLDVLQKKTGVYVFRPKAMFEHPGNSESYQNNVKMNINT